MRGPIEPILRTEPVGRREERLPLCWVERPGDARALALPGPSAADLGALAVGPVLLAWLGPQPQPLALDLLRRAAQGGVRIYALVSPGPGEKAMADLGGAVLRRRL